MRPVILAGISIKGSHDDFEVRMEECEHLCQACGMEVVGRVSQQSNSLDPRTAFRSGKLEELHAAVNALGADAVVFDRELPIAVSSRIQEACGVQVIDRTALILDIFSHRARSKQAKMQVELARLLYALPAIAAKEEAEDHSRGGSFRTRGAGETRTAEIRRTYRKRIAALKRELAELDQNYRAAEHRRSKSELARCALIGYTNAGKSSLLNAILKENGKEDRQVYAEDILFATLDSSVRNVSWGDQQFLLYDTVGFVSDLPHTLIDAFHSTLDSARGADLLILVADCSDPRMEEKMRVTRDTLRAIHADDIPILTVFTKADLVREDDKPDGLAVSSVTGEGIPELLEAITASLYPKEKTMRCLVPYAKSGLLHDLGRVMRIDILEEGEAGYHVLVSGPAVRMKPLAMYEVRDENSMGNL